MVDLPPGHGGRRLAWAEGVDHIMRQTHGLATRAGAVDIEFGYDILDRILLAREDKPRASDRVEWWFKARRVINVRGQRPLWPIAYGKSVVDPGGDHAVGCARAAVDFLEQLGVHVDVVDLGAGT